MLNTPEFKKAAIDWLLANGKCESMTTSTGSALAALSVRGVDYEASDMPDFTTVTIDAGDTFTRATSGEAFAATVYPVGYDPSNWHEGYEFWVGKDDLMKVFLSNMIAGVIQAAASGDAEWKAKAYQPEVERIERYRAAEAERARRLDEARAAKKAAQAAPATATKGMTFVHEGTEVAVTEVTDTDYTFATTNPMDEWQSWTLPLPSSEPTQ